jgi:hypothetical protein
MDFRKRVPLEQLLEILGALVLLLWRVWATAIVGVWRDWLAWLALYWFLDVLISHPRVRPWLAVGTMAVLMAIYGSGQGPNLSALLGNPS